MSLQPGQIVGQHEIIERIGSGGMAAVYRAQHLKLGRIDAIKVMHAGFADDADLLERFQREARIVASLDHPHIVPVYDFDEADGQPYLVMKFIEGRTLKWHMRKHVLSLDEINTICTAVADALTYAHGQGVLHRDVKPGNVVLGTDNTPYLTDFGLARIASQGESSMSAGMIVGTPHYLSPEQASGALEIGPGADIYALGVMLYEMVVGRVPFSAETPHAIVHDHIFTAPPPPSLANADVPEEVSAVLLRALEKDPADRYTTPNDMMSAFKLAVQQSGLTELRDDRGEIAAQSIAQIPKHKHVPRRQTVEAEIDMGEVWRGVTSTAGRVFSDAMRSVSNDKFSDERPYKPPTRAELDSQLRRRVERRVSARKVWRAHMAVFLVVNTLLVVGGGIGSNMGLIALETELQALPPANEVAIAEMQIAITAVDQPWILMVSLFWLGGLMAHRAYVGSFATKVAQKRQRVLERSLTRTYGPNWRDTITRGQYARMESQVEAHFCKRQAFWSHVNVFVYGNIALAAGWTMVTNILAKVSDMLVLQSDPQGAQFTQAMSDTPVFLMVTLMWLVGLAIHGIRVFVSGVGDDVEQEYERELSATLSKRQPKRKHELKDVSPQPAVRFDADGELTNSTVEAWGEEARR